LTDKDNIILLLAFSERQGERVADNYLEVIQIPKDLDRRGFTQDVCALVSRYHDMSENAPRRADMLLEKLATDQITIRLESDRVVDAVKSLNRAANRLSLGLLASALIVGGGYVLGR
jgi:hypothetical protein